MAVGASALLLRAAAALIQAGTRPQGQGVPPFTPDSGPIGAHQQIALDSTVRAHTLPDPVIATVQWIFQRPPWVMWGGAILAASVAALVCWWIWTHRAALRHWFATRSAGVTAALAAGVVALVALAAILGHRTYQFVEHDNRMCTGCHVFVGSGEAWVLPDTGYYSLVPRLEGKHDTLSCHACHALHPVKEAVKMVYWMSGRRDTTIPPHAKVPRDVCARCHIQGEAKETWQAIAATAGHRTHLESDSSALKGKIECLTCHAQTAHRFQPANATCAQSGCHSDVKIVLGRMSRQTRMHCTACHDFTATVPALATRDSAARTLSPNIQQCLSCHPMQRLVGEFDPKQDPHKGQCGLCHNPHEQTRPAQAIKSCTTSGCHGDWRKVPFHTGAIHRRVAADSTTCATCHVPHRARVDASDCTGCHTSVRERKRHPDLHPPLPFDTTRALRTFSLRPAPHPDLVPPRGPERAPPRGKGDVPPADDAPAPAVAAAVTAAAATAPDSFSHARHRSLPCLTCHDVASRTRRLTFERPRGCQICHHQASRRNDCAQCHRPAEIADSMPLQVAIAAARQPPRSRTVAFSHPAHREIACVQCHTTPVTRAPSDSAATCRACHDQHHTVGRSCGTCHRGEEVRTAHAPPVNAHQDCDACHAPATVAELTPTRPLCLTCHQPQREHYADRQCTTCHFLTSPEAYRSHLRRGAA
ncbi:MAG TPA: cytochrome c3 family protein [Gemmatimonadales bacterium]|nr:cytochrome c3 family protein [Gemmatimonadales bacterium]